MMSHSLTRILIVLSLSIASCTHEPMNLTTPDETEDNYPSEISKIIKSNCAVAGCHNAASYQISGGGLRMDTWAHMFEGGNTGAAVVAYSPENSPLLYFTNSFPDLGAIPPANMKMPLNQPPISRGDYLALRQWIADGAPDKNGNIPFASNADTRQKIYAIHQGCDYVTVIDAATNVVMRCIKADRQAPVESGHSLRISPDGKYAFANFWSDQFIQQIDTRNDSIIANIDAGSSNSNMLEVTHDSRYLLVTNWFLNKLIRIDIATGQIAGILGSGFTAPHGIAQNSGSDIFYVTEQYGNIIYKITAAGAVTSISIDGKPLTTDPTGAPNPHNIIMSPDHSKYFVSCEGTGEVRVMDVATDTVIRIIPVGRTAQEMAISRTLPYLFVTCLDEPGTLPIYPGAVYIIDMHTYQVVKKINDRYNYPHAITVDDISGKLFVFSRNIDPNGPLPHHNSSECAGRNGYYGVYDINNLQPVNNRRYEVTIDPYSADTRFK
jgi:DNA-binding beta-propeller fold protein YncE